MGSDQSRNREDAFRQSSRNNSIYDHLDTNRRAPQPYSFSYHDTTNASTGYVPRATSYTPAARSPTPVPPPPPLAPVARTVTSSSSRPPDLARPSQPVKVSPQPATVQQSSSTMAGLTDKDYVTMMRQMSLQQNRVAPSSSSTFGSEYKNSMGAAFLVAKENSKQSGSSASDTDKAASNVSRRANMTATNATSATGKSSTNNTGRPPMPGLPHAPSNVHMHVKTRTVKRTVAEVHQRKNSSADGKNESSSRQQKGPPAKSNGQNDHEKKHASKDRSNGTVRSRNFVPRNHQGFKPFHHGPQDVKFTSLSYPYIYLEQFGTIARSIPAAGAESFEPIVYLDKPLSPGLGFIFTIEETNDATSKSNIVMVVGLTTCGPSKLREFFYHVNESCKNGELDCRGYSLSLPIYAGDSPAQSVTLEKLEKGSLARLTTHFADKSQPKSRAIKDLTNGKMSSQPLFPFLVLSGLVSKVRVQSEAIFKKPLSVVKAAASAAAATVKTVSTDSWLVARGIEASKRFFTRQSDGPFYGLCKERLAPGQEYCFTISQIDDNVTGETLTIGFTTLDLSSLQIDSLPQPMQLSSKGWKVFNNVLPAVSLDDVIKIRVTATGISIESPTVPSRPLMRNVPPRAHLFIYMTGKILKLEFPRAEGDKQAEPVEEKKKPREPSSEDRGICCTCLEKRSDHILLPCKHLCVCGGCLDQINIGDRRCPICRSPVDSSLSVFVT